MRVLIWLICTRNTLLEDHHTHLNQTGRCSDHSCYKWKQLKHHRVDCRPVWEFPYSYQFSTNSLSVNTLITLPVNLITLTIVTPTHTHYTHTHTHTLHTHTHTHTTHTHTLHTHYKLPFLQNKVSLYFHSQSRTSQQLFDINDITLEEDLLMDLNFDIIPELQSRKPPLDSNKATTMEEAGKRCLHALLELKTPIVHFHES